MQGETLRIGVIGVGGMGARHARNLATVVSGVRVSAVMDVDKARAEEVGAAAGGARAFTDAHELIADGDVDAVVIAAPDPFHAELARACLEVGKPVLCEKPLATSVEDAVAVIRAEAKLGRRLIQLGLMREYDPAHAALKQAIDRGDTGPALYIRGTHNNSRLEFSRTAEDVIVNSAVHDIHSIRWLSGKDVKSVFAQTVPADPARPETCRLLLVQMAMTDGTLATIEVNSESGYGYEVFVEAVGSSGSARTTSLTAPEVRSAGTAARAVEPDWLLRFDTAYGLEAQAWVRSLIDGVPTGPSAWDGYAAMAVADACIRSVASGRPEAVDLVERPALYDR